MRWFLFIILTLSLITTWLFWRHTLSSLGPPPTPPTPFERQWGFDVSAEMARVINTKLPTPLKAKTFEGGIDQLRDAGHVNIFVNWRTLTPLGVNKQKPVSINLGGQSLADAIHALLTTISTDKIHLAAIIDEDVITISTVEDLAKSTVTRTYDVRDLSPQSPGAAIRLIPPTARHSPLNTTAIALMQNIETTVDPKSWRSNGGGAGAEVMLSGQLIVTQTELNQRDLQSLLYRIRRRNRLRPLAIQTGVGYGCFFALTGASGLLRRRRQRRLRLAWLLCARCGYDLRASTDRCPECGTPIPQPIRPARPEMI